MPGPVWLVTVFLAASELRKGFRDQADADVYAARWRKRGAFVQVAQVAHPGA